MLKRFVFILLVGFSTLFSTGCGKFSPVSPDLEQKVNNQNGELEEMKSVQNGLAAEVGKLRQQTDIHARDIGSFQQAVVAKSNSGIQVFQGDGALILVFSLGVVAMILIYHYRSSAIKHEKATAILAKQITHHQDPELENQVFLAALNTDVESHVYKAIIKAKN